MVLVIDYRYKEPHQYESVESDGVYKAGLAPRPNSMNNGHVFGTLHTHMCTNLVPSLVRYFGYLPARSGANEGNNVNIMHMSLNLFRWQLDWVVGCEQEKV
ncbi:unnamed protein product, partial [Ectocarpus sp. 12 AP-2014]